MHLVSRLPYSELSNNEPIIGNKELKRINPILRAKQITVISGLSLSIILISSIWFAVESSFLELFSLNLTITCGLAYATHWQAKTQKDATETVFNKLKVKYEKMAEALDRYSKNPNPSFIQNSVKIANDILTGQETIIEEIRSLEIFSPQQIQALVAPLLNKAENISPQATSLQLF